jgi:hypothetical protein
MSKAIDLGKKPEDLIKVIGPGLNSGEAHYPDLYLSDVDPALADLPDKGECTIRYRVVSRTHREEKGADGKKERSCCLRLEITSITPPPSRKKNGNGYGDDARKSFSNYFKDK